MRKYIERDIFGEVVKYIDKPEIILITGARQVGKTVLIEMIKEWLTTEKKVPNQNILSFNLDLIKDWEFFQDQTQFIEFIKGRSQKGKIYIFVDEAQKVKDPGVFFKGVYDSNLSAKLILSGSASFELKTKLKESLSGRKIIFNLHPFSFAEFLRAKDKELLEILKSSSNIPLLERKRIISLFHNYVLWGGYPRVVLSENNEEKLRILGEIYSSYIEKDIVGLLEIKNRLAFSRLTKLLAGQIGQLVNISELSTSLNIDRITCEKYLKILEETFIIKHLLPYFKNPRQEIIKQNKIYFLDTGLRNYEIENFSSFIQRADAGFLMENAVFREILFSLRQFEKIRFWRTKPGAEVDFLITDMKKILPLEVKLNLKKPSISLGMRSFIEKYKPEKAIIVNLNLFAQSIKIDKTKIFFIHPYEIFRFK